MLIRRRIHCARAGALARLETSKPARADPTSYGRTLLGSRSKGGICYDIHDAQGESTGNQLYFYYWLYGSSASVEVYFHGDAQEAPVLQIKHQDAKGNWGDWTSMAPNTTSSWAAEVSSTGGTSAAASFKVLDPS